MIEQKNTCNAYNFDRRLRSFTIYHWHLLEKWRPISLSWPTPRLGTTYPNQYFSTYRKPRVSKRLLIWKWERHSLWDSAWKFTNCSSFGMARMRTMNPDLPVNICSEEQLDVTLYPHHLLFYPTALLPSASCVFRSHAVLRLRKDTD